ncbi:MAG: hypothetical protein JXJ20_13850 [Anaerolineae bacterium]|nr:hypothetical protein [Anaerolineae bacterium]
MEIISAAHNLTIQLSPTTWRLLNGSQDLDELDILPPLMEAQQTGIACSPAFTRARQLPGNGQLVPADVARVVVGWAPESQNWHLGLLLSATPETGYKMRWCGLASWPSSHAGEHLTSAKLAGQSLARIIDRPFHLIPAEREPVNNLSATQPLQVTTRMSALGLSAQTAPPVMPQAPDIALQTPPFEFEDWCMVEVPRGFVWQRQSQWLIGGLVRALIFGVLAVLFLVLGIGVQTSRLATVTPEWLPWVGIVVSILLIITTVHTFFMLARVGDVIIDVTLREVRRQNRFSPKVQWRLPFDSIAYLVISQTPARAQGRPKRNQPMRTAQDVWLHMYDGQRFWQIAALGRVEGQCHVWSAVRMAQKQRGRRPLELAHYDTPAHHAAQVTAHAIGTGLWLDIR